MNKKEQKQFVKELCGGIAKTICEQIKKGRVPENWDGFELRYLIAEKAEHAKYKMGNSRARDYRNTVMINGL